MCRNYSLYRWWVVVLYSALLLSRILRFLLTVLPAPLTLPRPPVPRVLRAAVIRHGQHVEHGSAHALSDLAQLLLAEAAAAPPGDLQLRPEDDLVGEVGLSAHVFAQLPGNVRDQVVDRRRDQHHRVLKTEGTDTAVAVQCFWCYRKCSLKQRARCHKQRWWGELSQTEHSWSTHLEYEDKDKLRSHHVPECLGKLVLL